jgi:hypothetical protein
MCLRDWDPRLGDAPTPLGHGTGYHRSRGSGEDQSRTKVKGACIGRHVLPLSIPCEGYESFGGAQAPGTISLFKMLALVLCLP